MPLNVTVARDMWERICTSDDDSSTKDLGWKAHDTTRIAPTSPTKENGGFARHRAKPPFVVRSETLCG
jgi:hypothetical protein